MFRSKVRGSCSEFRCNSAADLGVTDVGGSGTEGFLQFVSMDVTEPHLSSKEAQLIKRVCGGEPQAFEELVRPYERLVYATAISILKNPQDAEEVAQEAVLKAFVHLSSFRGESKFSTWLVQITFNEARMKLRKDRPHLYESIDTQQQDAEGDYWPRDFADWRPIPSELLETDQAREGLENAINSLGPRYRDVVVLRDVENLSIKDTAVILGITEGSVKTRLHRGRLILRDLLSPGITGRWRTGKQ
jgi:RNA polymerase sigma-70 factor, ECF subfamily